MNRLNIGTLFLPAFDQEIDKKDNTRPYNRIHQQTDQNGNNWITHKFPLKIYLYTDAIIVTEKSVFSNVDCDVDMTRFVIQPLLFFPFVNSNLFWI